MIRLDSNGCLVHKMRKTTKTIEKLKVTIKRPNGNIEVVYKTENVRYIGAIERAQEQVIKAAREAGRGDIQSFEVVGEEAPMSLNEIRDSIKGDLVANLDSQDCAIERDFNNGIGFHESAKFDDAINRLRLELAEFDAAHPEVLAEIKKKKKSKLSSISKAR